MPLLDEPQQQAPYSTESVTGVIAIPALEVELRAALGPPSSRTWFMVGGAGRAVVTFSPDAVQAPAIRAVLDAHVSPEAVALRAANALAIAAAPAGVAGLRQRQRDTALADLEREIASQPEAQQKAFRLTLDLLKG